MFKKANKIIDLINDVQIDFMYNVFCDFDFKHRCLKQKTELIRHLANLQRYIQIYEQSAYSSKQFLLFIKTTRLPMMQHTRHACQHFMIDSLNKKDVMESLTGIQITQRRTRREGNKCLLKLMKTPEVHQHLTVTGGHVLPYDFHHLSPVTPDKVWVSDTRNNLIFKNTAGDTLHHITDLCKGDGVHTVNSKSELIYIDRKHSIQKLSNDMKTLTTFIKATLPKWKPLCVYWSPFTEDLLVGMDGVHYFSTPNTGIVIRYNVTQSMQQNNSGQNMYRKPQFITYSNTGDILVSDFCNGFGSVVVTERGGSHRFSYTGHKSVIQPLRICTDTLSHILVCERATRSVHMLDKDGQFLSHILIRPPGIFSPKSLSYDVNTNSLWVISKNKIVVYSYIDLRDALTGKSECFYLNKFYV